MNHGCRPGLLHRPSIRRSFFYSDRRPILFSDRTPPLDAIKDTEYYEKSGRCCYRDTAKAESSAGSVPRRTRDEGEHSVYDRVDCAEEEEEGGPKEVQMVWLVLLK